MGNDIAARMVERRDYLLVAVAEQDPRVRGKSFRAADMTVLVHEHDGFVLSVKAQPAGAQAVGFGSPACRLGIALFIHLSSTF
jgi:hypothetical protein